MIASRPPSLVGRLLSGNVAQVISFCVVLAFTIVVGFNLIWDEIHGLGITNTTSTLLNFLLTFAGLVTGFHVGSGTVSSGANQGITAVINPASLTVDSAGRPNGTNDNIQTTQSSSMAGGPSIRRNAANVPVGPLSSSESTVAPSTTERGGT